MAPAGDSSSLRKAARIIALAVQNPQTHDFAGGYDSKVGNLIAELRKNPLLSGVTLSGGDPFAQAEPFAVLAAEVHKLGLNVITYTGWTYEQIMDGLDSHAGWRDLLACFPPKWGYQ